MSEPLLPGQFVELERWVGQWSWPTEAQRYARRLSLSLSEVRAFYDALLPRMEEIMGYLRNFPADEPAALPVPTRNLFQLALSFMEASHPIELRWQGVDLDEAFPASRIEYHPPSSVS